MSKKQHKPFKGKKNKNNTEPKEQHPYKKPLLRATLKSVFFISVLLIGLFYSDYKGYFNPNQANNHTLKKWDWFYKFTKKNNVDILLLGNSHLYSGINPKNLSATLGANSFIIATQSTNISDTYFGLKEALRSCEPKLVIIETFGINNFNPYDLKEGSLTDQFKSFSARRNIIDKADATPLLFSPENYPYAWSNTIRNHDFIFTNKQQLEKNKKLIDGKKKKEKDKLYLGRFVRFTKGLQDSVLNIYKESGAPIDGTDYKYSKYAEKYVNKIVSLCEKKDIEIMFLTIPMYSKHVANYAPWKKELNKLLKPFNKKWLDFQEKEFDASFPTICFENTYSSNQHLTLQGSLIATYKLADFIRDDLAINLPKRNKEDNWHRLFYAEEGYFENFPVSPNDTKNYSISKNKKIQNIELNDVLLIDDSKNKRKKLLVKIDRKKLQGKDLKKSTLILVIKVMENNKELNAKIQLEYDGLHETPDKAIYQRMLMPIDVIDVVDGIIYL
jgi:hypothetical protein